MTDYKSNSLKFFNENAGKNYGNSTKLDNPVLKVSRIKENDTILDIGCGEGRFLNYLSNKYKNITLFGLDISDEMIRIARKERVRNTNYIIGESENIPLSNKSVNTIFCLNSFHHFPNPSNSFEEMKRLLKPDGEIIIGDIWVFPVMRELINAYLPFSKSGDVKMYSKKDLKKIINPLGLELTYYKIVSPFLFVAKIKLKI